MTPASAIASLDRQLAEHGEDVFLRKTNTAAGQAQVRAKIRSYKPNEIAGIIQQGDSEIVISPTGLEVFGVPPQNGYVVVAGAPRRIILPNPIRMGDVLVRIELQVRG